MNLEGLSKESLVCLLKTMLDAGLIKNEEAERILKENPTNELKRCTDFVHQLFCSNYHPPLQAIAQGQYNTDDCLYLGEESLENCWAQPKHKKWLDKTTQIMRDLGVGNEEELMKTYNLAKPLLDRIVELEQKAPSALALALRIRRLVQLSNGPDDQNP